MSKKKPLTVNKVPSQKQVKDWYARIAAYGCVVTGVEHGFQIHHPVGRTKRVVMGVAKYHVGSWFCYPLIKRLHDINSDDPLNVTKFRNKFVAQHGDECNLFMSMCTDLEVYGPLPFDADVMAAIMETGV